MTDKQILSIIKKNNFLDIFSIKKLKSQNNKVFLINNKYIFKTTAKNGKYFKFLEKITKNLKIKIPKVIKIKKIDFHTNLIIYKSLNGNSFNGARAMKPKTWKEIGACLKNIHLLAKDGANKKLVKKFFKNNHNLFFNNFIKYKNLHKKLIPQIISKNEFKKTYEYLAELKKINKKEIALLHGDYVFKNILFNKRKKISGIIDFEGAEIGDPLLELGYIYLWDGLMTNCDFIFQGYFCNNNLSKKKLITIKKYSVICALILLSKNDLNSDQYIWIKKRFKHIIRELSI